MRIKLAKTKRRDGTKTGRGTAEGQVRDVASSRSTGGQVVGSPQQNSKKQKQKKMIRYPKRSERWRRRKGRKTDREKARERVREI